MKVLVEIRNENGQLIDQWITFDGLDVAMKDALAFYDGYMVSCLQVSA